MNVFLLSLFAVKNEHLSFMNAQTEVKCKGDDGEVTKQATPFLHMATNAEDKRHIIGDKFVEIAEEVMSTLKAKTKRIIFLAQGMPAQRRISNDNCY